MFRIDVVTLIEPTFYLYKLINQFDQAFHHGYLISHLAEEEFNFTNISVIQYPSEA